MTSQSRKRLAEMPFFGPGPSLFFETRKKSAAAIRQVRSETVKPYGPIACVSRYSIVQKKVTPEARHSPASGWTETS